MGTKRGATKRGGSHYETLHYENENENQNENTNGNETRSYETWR